MTVIDRHTPLVRITHWVTAASFLFLLPSGMAILIAHPELYWGETGYFGEPAAFVLPVETDVDQTAWGRGMHFTFAWVLVVNGLIYFVCGLCSGHFRRKLLPTGEQLRLRRVLHEAREHLRLRAPRGEALREYNVLQKIAYLIVVFLLLPTMLLTGLTMSPAVTAAFPELFILFGGRQSARTIHFIGASLLVLFLLIHLVQIFRAGAANELRAMITGKLVIDPERS